MEEKNATLLKFSGFPLFQILGRKLPFHPLLNSQSSRSGPKWHGLFLYYYFQIAVTPTLFSTTPEARDRFDPKDRGCYVEGELPLKYLPSKFYRYEMSNCLFEAAYEQILDECKCMPRFGVINFFKLVGYKYGKILFYGPKNGGLLFCIPSVTSIRQDLYFIAICRPERFFFIQSNSFEQSWN